MTTLKTMALCAVCTGGGAFAASGWAIGSDHRALRGLGIADVGEVSHEEYRDYRTGQTLEWFEYTGAERFCFVLPNYNEYWGYGDKSAMIVFDTAERMYMAIVDNVVSSIRVDVENFETVRCPR